MTLGPKLQAAAVKVNTKLGTQDGPVTFRKRVNTHASEWGTSYASTSTTDVTITSGLQVGHVAASQAGAGGTIRVGDLRLLIPGSLVTEAQLTDATVVYKGLEYAIKARRKVQVYSGVVVQWEVIARETTGDG